MKSLPLYFYFDEFLRTVWVTWCENILLNTGEAKHHTSRGFQEKLNDFSSTPRTRANEAWTLGLLKGEIVNARSGTRDVPLGWEMSFSNDGCISRYGHLCYAVGKALSKSSQSNEEPSTAIVNALSALSAIAILQFGVATQNQYVLTSSLFLHILRSFTKPDEISQLVWHRYIATGMFCTLEHEQKSEGLLNEYFRGELSNELIFSKDSGRIDSFTPKSIKELIFKKYSLTDVTKPKSALFFVGSEGNARGMFTNAIVVGEQLLNYSYDIEKKYTEKKSISPFQAIANKQGGQEVGCVLRDLGHVFDQHELAKLEWRRIMNQLRKGVVESLKYIDGDDRLESISSLYAHGLIGEILDPDIVITVHKDKCQDTIKKDDFIICGEVTYQVLDIENENEYLKIRASKR